VRRWTAIGLALAATAIVSNADASTVYQQSNNGNACSPSCWTSSTTDLINGFRTFDNFILADAATITSVKWRGFYYDFVTPGANPVAPNTDQWIINFFSDGGSAPNGILYSNLFSSAAVARTRITTSSFSGAPVELYEFSVELPIAFSAAAGTSYWFSPHSVQTQFNPIFSWSAGTGGDDRTVQSANSGAFEDRPNDRAFSLATAVPEPGSWAMMIAGFGIIGGLMRRRLRKRAQIDVAVAG
jgi:hypothetical protein